MAITEKNLAYDLSLFEPQPKERKRNNIVKLPQEKLKRNARMKIRRKIVLSGLAVSAIPVFILSSIVYGQVQLSELTERIHTANKDLSESQSIYTQLSMKLEASLSLREIEEYSKDYLGMKKPDPHQIEYISLSNKDRAELEKNNCEGNLLKAISQTFSKLWPF